MITANELRIGNWVMAGKIAKADKDGKPTSEYKANYIQLQLSDFTDERFWGGLGIIIGPIPLTPEILEKAGFIKEDDGISEYHKLVICRSEVISIEDDWSFGLNAEDESSKQGYASSDGVCQYVHQLQNLYFALTGTELEINL
jgi:hypothetical protein